MNFEWIYCGFRSFSFVFVRFRSFSFVFVRFRSFSFVFVRFRAHPFWAGKLVSASNFSVSRPTAVFHGDVRAKGLKMLCGLAEGRFSFEYAVIVVEF